MRTTRNGRSDFNNAVLFVHGIGSQQRGAYLANNAAALEMALVERGAVVELTTRGELASERMEGRDWLCWTVRYRNRTERWLIAEAWWANSFDLPSLDATFQWLRRIFPAVLNLHFGAAVVLPLFARMRAMESTRSLSPRMAAKLGWLVATGTLKLLWGFLWRLGILLLGAGLVLTIGAARALPGTRSLVHAHPVKAILAWINDLAGDVAAFADGAARRQMIDKVSRDFLWCTSQANRTVVVAHSQGAAVSRHVLNAHGNERTTFVTLGAGTSMLASLSQLDRPVARRIGLAAFFAAISAFSTQFWLLFVVLPCIRRVQRTDVILECSRTLGRRPSDSDACKELAERSSLTGPLIAALAGVAAFLALLAAVDLFRRAFARSGAVDLWARRVELLDLPADRVRVWVDFYSPFDPVPVGPLLDDVADHCVEVSNTYLLLSEHTGYISNPHVMGFVAWAGLVPSADYEAYVRLPEAATLLTLSKRRSGRLTVALSAAGSTLSVAFAFLCSRFPGWVLPVVASTGLISVWWIAGLRPQIPLVVGSAGGWRRAVARRGFALEAQGEPLELDVAAFEAPSQNSSDPSVGVGLYLLQGAPGAGKRTLMLELLRELSGRGADPLIVDLANVGPQVRFSSAVQRARGLRARVRHPLGGGGPPDLVAILNLDAHAELERTRFVVEANNYLHEVGALGLATTDSVPDQTSSRPDASSPVRVRACRGISREHLEDHLRTRGPEWSRLVEGAESERPSRVLAQLTNPLLLSWSRLIADPQVLVDAARSGDEGVAAALARAHLDATVSRDDLRWLSWIARFKAGRLDDEDLNRVDTRVLGTPSRPEAFMLNETVCDHLPGGWRTRRAAGLCAGPAAIGLTYMGLVVAELVSRGASIVAFRVGAVALALCAFWVAMGVLLIAPFWLKVVGVEGSQPVLLTWWGRLLVVASQIVLLRYLVSRPDPSVGSAILLSAPYWLTLAALISGRRSVTSLAPRNRARFLWKSARRDSAWLGLAFSTSLATWFWFGSSAGNSSKSATTFAIFAAIVTVAVYRWCGGWYVVAQRYVWRRTLRKTVAGPSMMTSMVRSMESGLMRPYCGGLAFVHPAIDSALVNYRSN